MLKIEKTDYEGFHTNPLPWDKVVAKFHSLSKPYIDPDLSMEIIETVDKIEFVQVEYLVWLLEKAHQES